MTNIIEIYTDGACKGNPGIGGWGALLRYGKYEKTLRGAEWETTNNRMELQAAVSALNAIKRPLPIILTTDSEYLRQGVTKWLLNWKKNNWKTASNKAIKNLDLWQQIDYFENLYQIQWCYVKGHSGHVDNERVDQLANLAILELKQSKNLAT